ncbi:peptidase C14 [Colletotrichum abscissum]
MDVIVCFLNDEDGAYCIVLLSIEEAIHAAGKDAGRATYPAAGSYRTAEMWSRHEERVSDIDAKGGTLDWPGVVTEVGILSALVKLLKGKNICLFDREAAVQALSNQEALSEEVLADLVEFLKSEGLQEYAVQVLEKQSTLPDTILQTLIGFFKHQDDRVRSRAVKLVRTQLKLSEKVMLTLSDLSKDESIQARCQVAEVLGAQSSLTEEASAIVVELAKDPDDDVRWYVTPALGITTLISLYEDDNQPCGIRNAAAQALGKKSRLPHKAMDVLARRLEQTIGDPEVAVDALCNHSNLSDKATAALLKCFKENDRHRSRVAIALNRQSVLSVATLDGIRDLLDSPSVDLVVPRICEQLPAIASFS